MRKCRPTASGEEVRKSIITFINEHYSKRHFVPTLDEIASATYISKSTAFYHIKVLEKNGTLRRRTDDVGRCFSRTLELVDSCRLDCSGLDIVDLAVMDSSGNFTESRMLLPLRLVGHWNSFVVTMDRDFKVEAVLSGDIVVVNKEGGTKDGELVAIECGGVGLARVSGLGFGGSSEVKLLGSVAAILRKY